MSATDIPQGLSGWAERSLAAGQNVLATSNQGTILLYREADRPLVVKTAMGTGALRRARSATLLREAEAYGRMAGIEGVPASFGLLDGRFLVLEYVEGLPYRDADILDRERWFAELLRVIRAFHDRGVAHGDLKSKSNLLVRDNGRPCVLDFGTTVLSKPGFHPVNRRMFEYLKRLDLNAWVKHKYQGRYQDASEEDRELLNYSLFESLLRKHRNRKLG